MMARSSWSEKLDEAFPAVFITISVLGLLIAMCNGSHIEVSIQSKPTETHTNAD